MRRGLTSICMAALLGAGCARGPTQILVVVDSDLQIPGDMDTIRVVGTSPELVVQQADARLGGDQAPLPRTAALAHEGGPLGPFLIEVSARRSGDSIVARSAEVFFVPGEVRVLEVFLGVSCVGMDCPEDETCAAGTCRAIEVSPGELRPYEGPGPQRDAGPGDDAGSARDAGACLVECEAGNPCQCADGCPCTLECSMNDCQAECDDDSAPCAVDGVNAEGPAITCSSGASCAIDLRDSDEARVSCSDGASCEVDCRGSTGCELDCGGGTACVLRCGDAEGCAIARCMPASAREECPDDVVTCNAPCP